jgi:hypothetical protein
MPRRDLATPDLFAWQPPKVAAGFDDGALSGNRLGSKISRAVALALKASGKSRSEVARLMSAELGQPVSADMLDAYASEAKESHRITLERFVALITVTGCVDLIGFVAGLFGQVVVPERYAALIELHLIEEHEREVTRRKEAVQAKWRAGR